MKEPSDSDERDDDESDDASDDDAAADSAPAPKPAAKAASKAKAPIIDVDAAIAKASPKAAKTVRLKIRRQDARDKPETRRWEEFEVAGAPRMTVHACLQAIRKRPLLKGGKDGTPVVWEASCLEESCGACTMLVNGRVRLACSTTVEEASPKGGVITLEPLQSFAVERDLVVDRSKTFEALKHVKAWAALDGTQTLGAGPQESEAHQQERYALSRCIACGACLEACPEYGESRAFIGPAAIGQARLFQLRTTDDADGKDRVEALMEEGGVADCGKAQNCVEVCPKAIPLVDAIAEMARATTKRLIWGWLLG